MSEVLKHDLLYIFGLAIMSSWLTMYLLLRQVNIHDLQDDKIADFWQKSPLLSLFLLFTATFADNYADVFIHSRGARLRIYGFGSLVIGIIVLGTLYNDIVRSVSSEEILLTANAVLMFISTLFSIAFSVVYSRKINE